MSIIFQKLKSLKRGSSEQETLQGRKLAQGNNIYTFRRLIFSPMGALLIFGAIAGFGLASYASLSFLIDYFNSESNRAIVVQHKQPDAVSANLPGMDDPLAPPPGSEPPPGSTPGITTGKVQGTPGQAEKVKEFKVPDYFIYQAKITIDDAALEIPDTPDMVVSERTPEKRALFPLKSVYTSLLKKKAKTSDQLSKPTPVDHLKPDNITKSQDFFYTPSKKDLVQPETSVTKKEAAKQELRSKSVTTSDSEKTISHEKEKKAWQEGIRLAKQKKTQKVSAIASLASDLEDAIEKDDIARTEQLLAQLALIKGVNSAYFLKLKAFKEIREENYDLARKILNKVLAKDSTDFEAGINMAVIEIRKQEFKNARQRLIRLKELHPSQNTIDDLLNML